MNFKLFLLIVISLAVSSCGGGGDSGPKDSDQDGIVDSIDAFPNDASESLDTDLDGIGNNADEDDDGDGVLDVDDAFPLDPEESLDSDSDGIGNNADIDDDGDGVNDDGDIFPLDPNESSDFDGDGIGNNADNDDDNDSYPDSIDTFPFDPYEHLDTDVDGIGNNADPDDDNDGILDEDDFFPTEKPSIEGNEAPIPFLVDSITGFVGTSLSLDATLTTDPNEDSIAYFWSIVSKPEGTSPALSDNTKSIAEFTADVEGDYEILLSVSDGYVTASTSVTVTVLSSTPVAVVGRDHKVIPGTIIFLDGLASNDPQNLALSYSWRVINKPSLSSATLDDTSRWNAVITPDVIGDYSIGLVVSNGDFSSEEVVQTIQVREAADLLEAKLLITNGGMSLPLVPWSDPNFNGTSACVISGTITQPPSYVWTYEGCQVYGQAGNPVSAILINNSTLNSFTALNLTAYSCLSELCSIKVTYNNVGPISADNQTLLPNNYIKIEMTLWSDSEITDGYAEFLVDEVGTIVGKFNLDFDEY